MLKCHHYYREFKSLKIYICNNNLKKLGKKWAKNADFTIFWTKKIIFLGKMIKPLSSPYYVLNSCKILEKIMNSFWDNRKCLPKIRRLAKCGPIFGPCWLNFSKTDIFTAKPIVVGCVQHYSTHFRHKLTKSLETFFR